MSTGFEPELAYLDVSCRVLLDDTDATSSVGGRGYSYYGVVDEGAIVVIRPDGYVGTIAPLDGISEIDEYFTRFMKI